MRKYEFLSNGIHLYTAFLTLQLFDRLKFHGICHIDERLNLMQKITFLPQIKASNHISVRYKSHTNVFLLEPFFVCCY